jgi:CRISPR/Cas system-associated endonuclease Cas1
MIQGFAEKFQLRDIMLFGEYSSITHPLLSGLNSPNIIVGMDTTNLA